MRSKSQSAKSNISNFERNFEKQQLYKRNKRYINIEKVQSNEAEYSILRRKPITSEDDRLSQKFHSSFMNSTAELTERLDKDIDKFKSRVSLSARGNRT